MTDHDDPDPGASARQRRAQDRAARTARLAERLRANLGRRKQQLRDRRRTEATAGDGDEPEPKP